MTPFVPVCMCVRVCVLLSISSCSFLNKEKLPESQARLLILKDFSYKSALTVILKAQKTAKLSTLFTDQGSF